MRKYVNREITKINSPSSESVTMVEPVQTSDKTMPIY
jgi:hypothetical protein